MPTELPAIPVKRYFTIGEVGELCGVKPHVLRYWEQEFSQLRPMKRRGNRRYYQHHEVLMIRRIRELLYEQGFTISGARNRLQELGLGHKTTAATLGVLSSGGKEEASEVDWRTTPPPREWVESASLRLELQEIRDFLDASLEESKIRAII
jgi:DNA-binding transcriptional MerR regulator